ncbi:guanine nucleotide-binding protein G(q) subunit alpha-like isoform X4 [Bactrocera dorsalis]|uniref:Guanine nucleotide-binding protein G(Q) subunit alpha-like isoform X4 n=1 Tax=Bactrocera dorsalis TaxID=27457 RepID=A0ABM3JJQ8_BACDO|nr:guanine nucleotide-binding protein G(q) subunit alpha-like isoform X4 [Bactrocera dorsalis]
MNQNSLEMVRRCCCFCGSRPVNSSQEGKEEDFNEQKINEELKRDTKEVNSEKKLLLLGTGEAGKSTFLKQMHINYGEGFSTDARLEYKRVIHQNILTAMQSMLNAMNVLRISYDKIENALMANTILIANVDAVTELDEMTLLTIKCLWADTGVQQCYERRREYQIIDSAKYFLDMLDRVTQPDYVPTNDHILHSRVVTTEIVEHVFDTQQNKTKRKSNKRQLLRIIDVGGQRSERENWLQCFDEVTAVIFLASLSEYDQTLIEEEGLSRMEESKCLFRIILSTSYFRKSSIILFLNKQDLLEEKIMTSHLVDYYPEYEGPKQNADSAKHFIRQMFEAMVDKDRIIYTHYTCATGTGEAGKSTFFKQMHINYGRGFSIEARLEYKRVIHQNILTAMQSMLNAMNVLRISYDKIENALMANSILIANVEAVTELDEMTLSAIKCLWADTGVQQCYGRRREYQIIDSAKYFLDMLDRVTQPDYVPTDDHILHSRVVTTEIVEHVFDTQQNKTKRTSNKRPLLRVIDVGGQRSERRKWLQFFDDVTAVIFLTSLSEYDQTLSEAKGLSRMEESKGLFRAILSTSYFRKSSIILFLNKQDLLEEKIMTSHLVDYYPEYEGPKQNADSAKYFIRQMFEAMVDKDRKIYTHYTCATDTRNFRVVFLAVQDTIMSHYLESIGIN